MRQKLIIILFLIAGISSGPLQAQKKSNKEVCFKSNMDCTNCQEKLTNYLKFEKGVKDLKVDLATNTIYIAYKEGKNSDEGLAKAIEKKGYEANKITIEAYEKITRTEETGNDKEQQVYPK